MRSAFYDSLILNKIGVTFGKWCSIRVWLLGFTLMCQAALLPAQEYPPLDAAIDTDNLPLDILQPVNDNNARPLAERIRVKDLYYQEVSVLTAPAVDDPPVDLPQANDQNSRDVGARIVAKLLIEQGFELGVPGLEQGFSFLIEPDEVDVVINILNEQGLTSEQLSENGITTGDYPFALRITGEQFPVKLRLNPDFFMPIKRNDDGSYSEYQEGENRPDAVTLSLPGDAAVIIRYNWDGEGDIQLTSGQANGPQDSPFQTIAVDQPFMLAESGVIVDVASIMLDLSDSDSPAGWQPNWKGLLFKQFKVAFNNGLDVPVTEVTLSADSNRAIGENDSNMAMAFENFSIGTGGFSGNMCAERISHNTTLFDIDVTLQTLCLDFTQNTLNGSQITALVADFPFFEGEMGLNLALDLQGNYTIGLDASNDPSGLVKLSANDVLDFYVQSAFFEHRAEEDLFLIGLNGQTELLFMQDSEGQNARIDVNGFTLDSAGNVSLDGGWITLPNKVSTDFQTFNVSLSQIGFGRSDPDPDSGNDTAQSWVGFTGGISLVDGLGAEAEVKRMQFLWPKRGDGVLEHVDVKVDGIRVAFEQPSVVRFEGLVEWFETPESTGFDSEGFAGKLQLDLLALNMAMQSRVVIGSASQPQDFKYFYLDFDTQFPTGIPLGQSGASLYGFLGTFAYNMAPNLNAFDSPVSWLNAYNRADNVVLTRPGDPGPTWSILQDAMAFGGGVLLGTTPDNGFALNAKLALTIATPGPLVMLNGQANILTPRTALGGDDTPLFTAVALYDGNENTFIVNLGVYFALQQLIEVNGDAEAFFDLDNPSNWHLYLGQREPESRRISAEILSLFNASAYYMIDPYGLDFGAKAGFGNKWKYGPMRVVVEAWVSYDAGISWRPIHAWGEAGFHGAVELRAFGVGMGLSADAQLAMRTPSPFALDGSFRVKMNLPWPLPDPKATVKLAWEKDPDSSPQALREIVTDMTLHTRKDQWLFAPELQSHSRNDGDGPDWPNSQVNNGLLSSPTASLPADGAQTITASAPLVPLDTFASIKFDKSVNDINNIGLDNAYSRQFAHRDIINEGEDDARVFQYDALNYVLYHDLKDGNPHDLSSPIDGDLYAVWPMIPMTAQQQADNALDIVSKNSFRYYTNATYLGYNDDGDQWSEWMAGHYGWNWCLDGQDEKDVTRQWENYHFFAPQADPNDVGNAFYPDGNIPVEQSPPEGGILCPPDISWLEDEDFILPPYSVFRLTLEGNVHGGDNAPYRRYGNSILFHTEGPPLSLRDYIRNTVPEFPDRPYYRNYHVGLQFNENYVNKLYRPDVEDNFLQLQVLDDNEAPVAGDIITRWDEAPSHTLSESETAWMALLAETGASEVDNLPSDDLIYGEYVLQDEQNAPVRPAQKHHVKVVYQDPRLQTDSRLASPQWLDRHNVTYANQQAGRVVLHQFDYLSSKYATFSHLIASYQNSGNQWFSLPVAGDINRIVNRDHLLNQNYRGIIEGNSNLSHDATQEIGVFLRHLLSPAAPDSFTDRTLHNYIARLPGYSDNIARLESRDLAQYQQIVSAWAESLSAFSQVEAELGLNRQYEPLPEQLEVNVLNRAADGRNIGLLIEAPEALDFSRIELAYDDGIIGNEDALIIPNAQNTRFFVFIVNADGARELRDGVHRLNFTFYRRLGEQLPFYHTPDGADTEVAELLLDLTRDQFDP